jgi:hypothetical protein
MATNELVDAKTAAELENLMTEFPDWQNKYPDIYRLIQPPIHSKASSKWNDVNNSCSSSYNNSHVTATNIDQKIPAVVEDNMDDIGSHTGLTSYSRHATAVVRRPRGKFASKTTSMDHYKWWNTEPSLPFSELPTFANYLIYPGRGRQLTTTSQATFRGEPAERSALIKPTESDIMTSRGRMDMKTTTSLAFQPYGHVQPAQKIDRSHDHDTSYLTTYIENDDDEVRDENNQRQTQRLSLPKQQSVHPIPVPRTSLPSWRQTDTRFDSQTVNQQYYKPWPVVPRLPVGDRYEVPFVPSNCRFDGRTTNSVTYTGQQLPAINNNQVPTAGKPSRHVGGSGPATRQEVTLAQLPDTQPRDYQTAYKSDFNRPNTIRNLSKSQAAILLRELRMRKQQRDASVAAGGMQNDVGKTTTSSRRYHTIPSNG